MFPPVEVLEHLSSIVSRTTTVVLMDIHIPAKLPQIAVIGLSRNHSGLSGARDYEGGGVGLFPKDEAVGKLYGLITQAISMKQSRTASRHELA